MKTEVSVKFDEMDLEILSSENELASINGGGLGKVLKEVLDFVGIEIDGNCACNNCNCPKNN
ncbi:MAG: hypothetical protein K2K64_11885 [Muribaculaceae bacterium]|nr:hypothetical protein [Muribaculaceae bacterium]